jgi:hypothetical protein
MATTITHCLGVLEELRELHLARPLAFAEDIFLRGTCGAVEAVFPVVCAVLEPLGLQVTLSKSSACSAVKADGVVVSGALGIHHAVEGITASGTPVARPPEGRLPLRRPTHRSAHPRHVTL